MANWRLAKSLEQLRKQINAAYPGRDKSSDGAIGDVAHQKAGTSDHLPNKAGVVTAIDIDEDLSSTIHSLEDLVSAIRASRDPRVKYIIYEGRITVQGSNLQKWKKYTGKNSHSHHCHISVATDPKLYDDPRPWAVFVAPAKVSATTPAKQSALPQSPTRSPDVSNDPPEIVPLPTDTKTELLPVEVPLISAAIEEPKVKEEPDKLVSIGNKATAVWTSAGATVMAIGAFLTSTPVGIAITIVGSIALLGVGYMIVTAVRQSGKERRAAEKELQIHLAEIELKKQRESDAVRLQLALIGSAEDPNKHTVVITPPSTEIPNSDNPENEVQA